MSGENQLIYSHIENSLLNNGSALLSKQYRRYCRPQCIAIATETTTGTPPNSYWDFAQSSPAGWLIKDKLNFSKNKQRIVFKTELSGAYDLDNNPIDAWYSSEEESPTDFLKSIGGLLGLYEDGIVSSNYGELALMIDSELTYKKYIFYNALDTLLINNYQETPVDNTIRFSIEDSFINAEPKPFTPSYHVNAYLNPEDERMYRRRDDSGAYPEFTDQILPNEDTLYHELYFNEDYIWRQGRGYISPEDDTYNQTYSAIVNFEITPNYLAHHPLCKHDNA